MSSSRPQNLSPALQEALTQLDGLIDWERRDRHDLERTLEPVKELLARLESPEKRWPCVHVTGTKGKSSTSAFLAQGLMRAGYRTGVYTSPHVVRVTERVRIDGRDAEDDAFASSIQRSLRAHEGTGATYFDVLTAASFDLLAREEIDWGVIECGLGGRLDSTNAVPSEVAVITNIDLEHTEVLGNTRAAIASEKVGILKPNSVLVTSIGPEDEEVWPVFELAARATGSEVCVVDVRGKRVQAANLALARETLDVLGERGFETAQGEPLSASLLEAGIENHATLPGRLEILSTSRGLLALDGAHVASSAARVLDEFESDARLRGLPVCILALRTDKDHRALLKTLSGRVDRVLCTSMDSAPFRAASELEAAAKEIGLTATAIESPREALDQAFDLAASDGWVLAIGSLYLAGALRQELGEA